MRNGILSLPARFGTRDTHGTSVLGLLLCFAWLVGCSTDTTVEKPATARIYATVSATAEVLVLDEVSHKVLSTISVGRGPAIILATPDHKKLYTANWADNTVSAIDVATEKVATIALKDRPYVIAMSPDGKYVYAGVNNVNEIAVINTQTDTIERSFTTDALPASIIVSPNGATLYVAKLGAGFSAAGNGTVEALSAATGEVVKKKLSVGGSPAWITIGADGSKVYTLNFTTDDVTVIDTAKWEVTATISTGRGSQGIIGNVTPDGSRLYVTNHGTSNMVAIDTASGQIVQTVALDGKPVGVNFNSDGSQVYVTDFGPASKNESPLQGLNYLLTGVYDSTGNGTVSAYNVATGELVGTKASTGPGPTSVVVLPAPSAMPKDGK